MDVCQFCQKQQNVKTLEGRTICSACLQLLFSQLLKEEKTKQESKVEENEKLDAIELVDHMLHSHLHTTHFHIEGINMNKWTDEKIGACLRWIRKELS